MKIRIAMYFFLCLFLLNACQKDASITQIDTFENEGIAPRTDCCGNSAFTAIPMYVYLQDKETTCCVYQVTYTNDENSGCKHYINTPDGLLTYEDSEEPVIIEQGQTYGFTFEVCTPDREIELSAVYPSGENFEECTSVTLSSDCVRDCCKDSEFTILAAASILDDKETCCKYNIQYANGSDCAHDIDLPDGTQLGPVQAGESIIFEIYVCSDEKELSPVSLISYFDGDPIQNQCEVLQLMPDCSVPPPPDCCQESGFINVSAPQPSDVIPGDNSCCDFNIRYRNGSDCIHQILDGSQIVQVVPPGMTVQFVHTVCSQGGEPEDNSHILRAMADDDGMTVCATAELIPDCGCPDCDAGFAAAFAYGRVFGEEGGNCNNPNADFHFIQTMIDFADCPEYLEGFLLGWTHGCNNPDSQCTDDCKCADNPDDE